MALAFGQVQGPDIRQETGSEDLHPYKWLSVNPGAGSMDIEEVRAVCDPDAVLAAYFNALAIPMATTTNPYWLALKQKFLLKSKCYCDVAGNFINFGTPTWPLARLQPTKKNANDIINFVRSNGILRQYTDIYLDDANFDFPNWVKLKLGGTYNDSLPMKHLDYMNRVVSGISESIGFGGTEARVNLTGNVASSGTHPSFSSISIEVKDATHPGATRDAALVLCKEQAAIGRGGRLNILWRAEGDAASNAMGGYWRE